VEVVGNNHSGERYVISSSKEGLVEHRKNGFKPVHYKQVIF